MPAEGKKRGQRQITPPPVLRCLRSFRPDPDEPLSAPALFLRVKKYRQRLFVLCRSLRELEKREPLLFTLYAPEIREKNLLVFRQAALDFRILESALLLCGEKVKIDVPRASEICFSLPTLMLLLPFSYFWICWYETPTWSASFI
jgi:hypothetical protein